MATDEPTNIFSVTWVLIKGLALHCADSSMRVSERVASLQLQSSFLVFIAGVIWVWLSATCEEITISNSFERSGSVLVLVAIYLDYSYRESAVAEISRSMQSAKYRLVAHYMIKLAAIVRPFAIFSGILGTLIWGYGGELQNT